MIELKPNRISKPRMTLILGAGFFWGAAIIATAGCKPKSQQSFVYNEETSHTANLQGSRGVLQIRLPDAAGRIQSVQSFRITTDRSNTLNPVPRAGRFAQMSFSTGSVELVVQTSNGNKCNLTSTGGLSSTLTASCGGTLSSVTPTPPLVPTATPGSGPTANPNATPTPTPGTGTNPGSEGPTPDVTATPLGAPDASNILRDNPTGQVATPEPALKVVSQSSPEPLMNDTNKAKINELRLACSEAGGIDQYQSTTNISGGEESYHCICASRPDKDQILSYWDFLDTTVESFKAACRNLTQTASPSPAPTGQ